MDGEKFIYIHKILRYIFVSLGTKHKATMERTLSKEEIQKLVHFTEKKYVDFYDVQIELVDHLASAIEDELRNDQNLTFETALDKVYGRFGIFGFDEVKSRKLAIIEKRNLKIWWLSVCTFFKGPVILLSILLYYFLYQVIKLVSVSDFYPYYSFLLLCANFACAFYYNRQFKQPVKKLAMLATGNIDTGTLTCFIYISGYLMKLLLPESIVLPALIYTLFTALIPAFISATAVLRAKAKEMYPEAFIL